VNRIKRAARDGRRLGRTLAAGGTTGIKGATLALAAGHVIAKRTALGMAALSDPAGADHAEFGCILPEKAKAFSASAMGLVQRSVEISRQIAQFSVTESMLVGRAAAALAQCRTPAAAVAVQTRFATDWYFRSLSHAVAVGALTMRACGDIITPLHQAAMGNARRLR
jgi:hypothetical protein